LRDNKKPWFGASSDTTSFSAVPVADAPQSEAKAGVAEARKVTPKLTIKWILARIEEAEAIDEGLRKAGLPEESVLGDFSLNEASRVRWRDFCSGSITSLSRCPRHVRFPSDSDGIADIPARQLRDV
jgi:hypothetical protein